MNTNTSVYNFVQLSLLSYLFVCCLGACNFSSEPSNDEVLNQVTVAKKADEPDLKEFKKVAAKESEHDSKKIQADKTKSDLQKNPESNKLNNNPEIRHVTSNPTPDKSLSKKPVVKKKVTKKPIAKQAKIVFEEPIHDFGVITEGDIIKHKFKFKNTGNSELLIKAAYASCGCTDPSYPFMGIPPGEEGFIGLTYNSVSKDGPQKPEVTIKTNVDDTAYVLYLEGIVKPKENEEALEKTDSLHLKKN